MIKKSNATKHIIVIDDDMLVLNSFKFMFKKLNILADYREKSKDAFCDILKNDYSFIITDIEMPDMNGIDMIRKIKAKKEIKNVVFISSNIQKYINKIKELNGFYLYKPIKKESLFDLLKE